MLLMNSAILADSRRVLKNLNQDVRNVAECQLVLVHLVIMVVRVFVSALLLFLFLSLFIVDFLLLSLLFNLKKHLAVINLVIDGGDEIFIELFEKHKRSFLE